MTNITTITNSYISGNCEIVNIITSVTVTEFIDVPWTTLDIIIYGGVGALAIVLLVVGVIWALKYLNLMRKIRWY